MEIGVDFGIKKHWQWWVYSCDLQYGIVTNSYCQHDRTQCHSSMLVLMPADRFLMLELTDSCGTCHDQLSQDLRNLAKQKNIGSAKQALLCVAFCCSMTGCFLRYFPHLESFPSNYLQHPPTQDCKDREHHNVVKMKTTSAFTTD